MDKALWQGRVDLEEDMPALRWHQVIQSWDRQSDLNNAAVLLGFACDEGVKRNQGRIGAKEGPKTLRQSLANLAYSYDKPPYDAGDILCQDGNLEGSQQLLAEHIQNILQHNGKPIILGGGHEVSWGSFLGLSNYLYSASNTQRIGIINFDAHFDLRNPSPHPSSGTPFRQIAQWCEFNNKAFNYLALGISPSSNTQALFEYAKQHRVSWQMDTNCTIDTLPDINQLLENFLEKIDELYLTICMDVFPAHVSPGVSAPSALGIDPVVVIKLIQHLKMLCPLHKVQWRISDIAELNPLYDQDGRTARLAARLLHELI